MFLGNYGVRATLFPFSIQLLSAKNGDRAMPLSFCSVLAPNSHDSVSSIKHPVAVFTLLPQHPPNHFPVHIRQPVASPLMLKSQPLMVDAK